MFNLSNIAKVCFSLVTELLIPFSVRSKDNIWRKTYLRCLLKKWIHRSKRFYKILPVGHLSLGIYLIPLSLNSVNTPLQITSLHRTYVDYSLTLFCCFLERVLCFITHAWIYFGGVKGLVEYFCFLKDFNIFGYSYIVSVLRFLIVLQLKWRFSKL